ncbi:MAG: DUF4405 domain-containing protein [Candidatus Omnitrophota bacterium]
MNKNVGMKIVNPLLMISVLAQMVTGIILGRGFFSAQVNTWYKIHEYNGYIFTFLAIAHVVLNWSWIKANFFKKKKAITAPGQNTTVAR